MIKIIKYHETVQIQGLRSQCPHFMAKKTEAKELSDLF